MLLEMHGVFFVDLFDGVLYFSLPLSLIDNFDFSKPVQTLASVLCALTVSLLLGAMQLSHESTCCLEILAFCLPRDVRCACFNGSTENSQVNWLAS